MFSINEELLLAIIATHLLLLLLPFLWFQLGCWQKRIGFVKGLNITYTLLVLFIVFEIMLLAINYDFLKPETSIKIVVSVLALPVNMLLLILSAISTLVYKKQTAS